MPFFQAGSYTLFDGHTSCPGRSEKVARYFGRSVLGFQICKYLLIISWTFGLIFGALVARNSVHLPMMICSIATQAPSLLHLLIVALLPFLFTALAVYLSKPWLIVPIALLKAFCFAFCTFGVVLAFGSAGWLVQLFLLFTDTCVIPILIFSWLRYLSHTERSMRGLLIVCSVAAFSIAMVDYFVISPFLLRLVEI